METSPVDQREQFLAEQRRGLYTMQELCDRYAISRKTGYKWVARVLEDGRRGLQDRSRAPHSCPHQTPPEIAALIVAARQKHPDWGPQLLLDWLRPRHPRVRQWPATSTAGAILLRAGLVKKRRRRRATTHPGVVDPITAVANDLWTADFKGQFRTQDRVYCYPLTIADQHTRFLLTCHGLTSVKGAEARPIFERTFREYGLPRAIRTDNGAPFVTRALCGLSFLNVWWMRLGIQHQRIHPASPQENGAHERMHRTLKRGAIRPPRATAGAQQRAFNAFRTLYNEERPHSHHGGTPPGAHYTASPREYPARLPPLEYPGHFVVKRVTDAGTIRFQNQLLFLANALQYYHIGLEEIDDGIWSIYFGSILLARLDERDRIIRE
jgi:transposase InsO family protein